MALHTIEDSVPFITDAHSILSAEYESKICGKIIKEKVDYLREVEGLVFRIGTSYGRGPWRTSEVLPELSLENAIYSAGCTTIYAYPW